MKFMDKSEQSIDRFLGLEGVNMSTEAEANTPKRFVKMFREMMGVGDPEWNFTTFDSDCDEMIVCSGIRFVSMCEHHLMPFIGAAHIGYIPQGRIVGLSKLPRVVHNFSRGLHQQEHLTMKIAKFLEKELKPRGVAVVMQAEHTCMTIRGIKAAGTMTTTSSMTGVFRDNQNQARGEFLGLI